MVTGEGEEGTDLLPLWSWDVRYPTGEWVLESSVEPECTRDVGPYAGRMRTTDESDSDRRW